MLRQNKLGRSGHKILIQASKRTASDCTINIFCSSCDDRHGRQYVPYMFPRIVIDDSRCVNDNSSVVIMTIASDATTWSLTYDHHSDDSIGVIYFRNIFIIQARSFCPTISDEENKFNAKCYELILLWF
jgi:hypothetical protein